MFAGLELMSQAHPSEPHWYLAWLGVDRGNQGYGLGTDLLTRRLAEVDATRQPAFLETPNPRTIPFYEHHGFTEVGRTQAGDGPPITFMYTPAR